MNTRDSNPTTEDGIPITFRAMAYTWLYGLVLGTLIACAFMPGAAEPFVVRILIFLAGITLAVLIHEGKLSRWMAPADRFIRGSWIWEARGGPKRPPLSPATFVYQGCLWSAAFIPALVLFPDRYGSHFEWWMFTLAGGTALVGGLIAHVWRQRRRRALGLH